MSVSSPWASIVMLPADVAIETAASPVDMSSAAVPESAAQETSVPSDFKNVLADPTANAAGSPLESP